MATLYTDERPAYRPIGRRFKHHEAVNHSRDEYVRGPAHVNTAESYFALLKRGMMGSFHHVSRQHLQRYVDEFSFRWNHRKVDDGARTATAIEGAAGKRLTYKEPIS
jgi:hypothetical protein